MRILGFMRVIENTANDKNAKMDQGVWEEGENRLERWNHGLDVIHWNSVLGTTVW